jgi:hypothetical protein
MRKTAAGSRFIWCQEAPVFERVPESRWSLTYYFRRQFRGGALDGEREKRPGRFLRSLAAVLIHAMRVLLLLPFGKQAYAKPLVSLANHLGYVSAAMGFIFSRKREEISCIKLPQNA